MNAFLPVAVVVLLGFLALALPTLLLALRVGEDAAAPHRPEDAWDVVAPALDLMAHESGGVRVRAGPDAGPRDVRILVPRGRATMVEATAMTGRAARVRLRAGSSFLHPAGRITPAGWDARSTGVRLSPELEALIGLRGTQVERLLRSPGVLWVELGIGSASLELELSPHDVLAIQERRVALQPKGRAAARVAAHLQELHASLAELAAIGPEGSIAATLHVSLAGLAAIGTSRPSSGQVCPWCKDDLDPEQPTATRCKSCRTAHHLVCWEEAQGCTVLGCERKATARHGPPERAR